MPMRKVTAKLRMKAVRSPRRIAQTPNWQVNERDDQEHRRRTDERQDLDMEGLAFVAGSIGGHCGAFARTLKYAANRPAKNMTSEVRNRSMPRTGLLMPPRASWARPGDRAVLGRREGVAVGRHPVASAQWLVFGPCRRSNSGRSERISGRWSKLYGGGGELVAHSSVLPSHGSSPAGLPLRSEMNTFHRSGSMLAAIVNPPIVASEVEVVPARRRGVVGDPPRHARQAQLVHREERQVEADEHQHELDLAQRLVQHPAGHLGEPVVQPGHDPEDRPAEQDVVEVGDDPVRVVEGEVDRHGRAERPVDARR